MKLGWMGAVCALALAACGGGGGDSGGGSDNGTVGQTPFQALVTQAQADPRQTDCTTQPGYSEQDAGEARVSASQRQIEIFGWNTLFGSANCSGAALLEARLRSGSQEVPQLRISFDSSVPGAQVQRLNGTRISTTVDRVTFSVNPGGGLYQFDFLGTTGTQTIAGTVTTANFTFNGNAISYSLEAEMPLTLSGGLALVDGDFIPLLPTGLSSFAEVDALQLPNR